MSYFTYNGRSSEEFGLHIEKKDVFSAPEYDAEFTSIPGRSGDLIVSNRRFANIKVSYTVFLARKNVTDLYETLVKLCTDICKRNGKKKLLWLGDKTKTLNYNPKSDEMVLTVHRWFANKSCPGNWLYARLGDLASKVTASLGGDTKPAEPTKPTAPIAVKAGDLVKITGTKYYGGQTIPPWVKAKNWFVHSVSGDRAVINKSEDGKNAIMSPVKVSNLALINAKPAETYRVHTVVHGDTLWTIAQKYLGKGNRYTEIVKLNGLKSNVIYSGMKLKIPN